MAWDDAGLVFRFARLTYSYHLQRTTRPLGGLDLTLTHTTCPHRRQRKTDVPGGLARKRDGARGTGSDDGGIRQDRPSPLMRLRASAIAEIDSDGGTDAKTNSPNSAFRSSGSFLPGPGLWFDADSPVA